MTTATQLHKRSFPISLLSSNCPDFILQHELAPLRRYPSKPLQPGQWVDLVLGRETLTMQNPVWAILCSLIPTAVAFALTVLWICLLARSSQCIGRSEFAE